MLAGTRLKSNYAKTDLTGRIRILIKELKLFIPEKNIRLFSRICKIQVMKADLDKITQILRNLIGYAIKFSNDNCIVLIFSEKTAGNILFRIKYFGMRISKKSHVKTFAPFLKEGHRIYREHEGTSLGLAICSGIAEAMNWKIWLESEKGKGSTFCFEVPLTLRDRFCENGIQ